ncbi:protachykinin-1 isoform X3 [Manacus candei]|uniref:protachykinin-1 isoform X3 n=1 Tax=Manacus candei TaxID=415023 RepID=UPI0022277989|nr:protachykinin-1 isoform X3 [Manacus candei]
MHVYLCVCIYVGRGEYLDVFRRVKDVEAAMRLPLAFAVLLLASAQALAEEMGATDDLSYWSDWSDSDQAKEELPLPLEHFLQRMARRPRPQQFFGLMGKRDAGSSEGSIAQNYERRRK